MKKGVKYAGQTERTFIGQKFERWTVISERTVGVNPKVNCRCLCGAEKPVHINSLLTGLSKSCGCLCKDLVTVRATKHGRLGTREYKSWQAMKSRCLSPTHTAYGWYGGRGIKVHKTFLTFQGFYDHVGPCPPGMTLDRIDHDGNYEPGNVRWASHKTQSRNMRSNVRFTFRGKTQPLIEWSEELRIPQASIRTALLNGLLKEKPVETIMNALVRRFR